MAKNRFSFLGLFLFFITSAFITTGAVLLTTACFDSNLRKIDISILLLIYIVITSFTATMIDYIRRKYMVNKPVNEIIKATNEISKGNYDYLLKLNIDVMSDFDIIKYNINILAKELKKTALMNNDFINNVSHEIKTPLQVISIYTKSLINESDDNKKEEYYQIINDSINRLTSLVSNVLMLTKLESQTINVEKNNVDICEVISECIIGFENKIDEKSLEIETELDEVTLKTNKGYLEIILNNLISNAIKFSNEFGTIKVICKDLKDKVEIKVCDNGIGINKENGSRIFEKFYQIDTSHKTGGNGLGLSLVKKLIDILEGKIEVESIENTKTVFTVTLKKE